MKARLVPLPYAYTELSPTIRKRTVHLHHDKHQNGYVKGWNRIWAKPSRNVDDWRNLTFHGSGVILHEMYWNNLTSRAEARRTRPSPELYLAMEQVFGSAQAMAEQMIDIGTAIQGSGWIILAWIPRFETLTLLPIQNHELNWIPGAVPLIVLDVWEHAYYLQYQNKRKDYLTAIWGNVNWNVVNERFAYALGEYE